MPYAKRLEKVRRGDWRIRLSRRHADRHDGTRPSSAPPADHLDNGDTAGLVEQLCQRGVSRGVATALVTDVAPQAIEEKIRYVDGLRKSGRKAPRNQAAYLVAAIRGDFQLQPPTDANSGPRRVGKPATAQPIEADLVTTQRINHWWQRFCQLSPEEAERVEDAALAQANPVTARTYARLKQKGSRLFESVRMSLLASYLERTHP